MIVQRFTQHEIAEAQLEATGYFIEWCKGESGIWVHEHSLSKPFVHCPDDPYGTEYIFVIEAKLTPEDKMYFVMRWGHEIRY